MVEKLKGAFHFVLLVLILVFSAMFMVSLVYLGYAIKLGVMLAIVIGAVFCIFFGALTLYCKYLFLVDRSIIVEIKRPRKLYNI